MLCLNQQPLINANELKLEKPVSVAGFYLPPKSSKVTTVIETPDESNYKQQDEELSTSMENKLDLNDENNNHNENNSVDEDDSNNNEESDEEGWITPSNLLEIQKQSIVDADKQEITDLKLKVGCMTSDFAMQVIKRKIIFF